VQRSGSAPAEGFRQIDHVDGLHEMKIETRLV
jgi:hypothetical protein